ncbi:hypothetical protein QVG61_13485 [Thiohalobacter sp. IOR34]|uniref:hypothetical protein n=1 Tax=Thiohalobacter sp. IOR34 TaxID=3057176 RepID=UPI0025AFBF8E|nr:hypothetical protein [Thiohalobacter sp. IOR34]WJW75483.1 hypothetical protein QVG61_13485 [Thiohalobacter sp. IOR34]
MGVIREIIGPRSKYEHDIPYTYEARISVMDEGQEYKTYLADTICALVEFLEQNAIDPEEVRIYEVYEEGETELNKDYCLSREGRWLSQEELCESLRSHYPGHIRKTGCTFEDRERDISGP